MTNYNQYFFLSLYRNCFSKKKKQKKLYFFSQIGVTSLFQTQHAETTFGNQ